MKSDRGSAQRQQVFLDKSFNARQVDITLAGETNLDLILYLPAQYLRLRSREITAAPESLIVDRIRDVLRNYAAACHKEQ